jgi:hypothetical protein
MDVTHHNFESYMLLSIENELLDDLDAEAIIDRFVQSCSELKRLLTCP